MNCSEIKWNANLMQLGNFIYIFLALHVSGTYARHQEHYMLSCSIWFSAPSFWKGGGLESGRVGCVCGADGDVRRTAPSAHTCRAKNTSIKLPSCIKLAFHFISWGRCTVKQRSWIAVPIHSCITLENRTYTSTVFPTGNDLSSDIQKLSQ